MKLIQAAVRVATVGVMVGGTVAAATAASATTVPRGTTPLLTCDNVVITAKANDPITKTGLNFTTHDIKVAGIGHPEKNAPSATNKVETNPGGTPDVGDTDSCLGTLSTNANPWNTAGTFAPYSPAQGTLASPINEIVGVAGSLTGRTDCATPAPPPNPSAWSLHGKLTIKFGNQAAVGTLATPQLLNTAPAAQAGKGSQAQVYVNSARPSSGPATDLDGDTIVDPISDLASFQGIGIKGVGEGAWFDQTTAFRPNLSGSASPPGFVVAAEACSFNADLNADTVIGQPTAGGLQILVTDTDVDSIIQGSSGCIDCTIVGPVPAAYNNSVVFSI